MRALTKETKADLALAFATWGECKLPQEVLIDKLLQHTIAVLELVDEHKEWFDDSKKD